MSLRKDTQKEGVLIEGSSDARTLLWDDVTMQGCHYESILHTHISLVNDFTVDPCPYVEMSLWKMFL